MMRICILLGGIWLTPFLAISQPGVHEVKKIKALELERLALRQQQLKMRLDTAIQLSKQGAYADAEKIFMSLLEKMDKIPSNLVYYFAENSFYLKKYAQSVDWLNKYIELKGTTGKFSRNAVARLKTAEKELVKTKKNELKTKGAITSLSPHTHVDCGPTGKVICPVCRGATVIVKRGYTRNIYKTCTYCHYRGYLDCEEYNKIIEGKLK